MQILIALGVVLALVLLTVRMIDPIESRRLKGVVELLKQYLPAILAVMFLLFVLAEMPRILPLVLGLFVIIMFAQAWVREFVFLMSLKDSEFPGRFDKLVWSLLMIFVPPVGLWIFRGIHLDRWPEPSKSTAKPEGVVSDFA